MQAFKQGSDANKLRCYAYGVTLDCDLPLPELPTTQRPADIHIRVGNVKLPPLLSTNIGRQGVHLSFGGTAEDAYFYWPGIAKFRAISGHTLVVDADSEQLESQRLNLYLLSEALGLLLMQRGLFLLHASAVQVGGQAAIFVGASHAGKSTTAAAFVCNGYPLLADDMVAIQFDDAGIAYIVPSFPQLKIWPPTAQGLGLDVSALPVLFKGSHKRVLRPTENFPQVPVPLQGIFLLEAGTKLQILPTAGPALLPTLAEFFSCPLGLLQGEALKRYFRQCTQLLNQVNVWTVTNPKTFPDLQRLMTDVSELLGNSMDQWPSMVVPRRP